MTELTQTPFGPLPPVRVSELNNVIQHVIAAFILVSQVEGGERQETSSLATFVRRNGGNHVQVHPANHHAMIGRIMLAYCRLTRPEQFPPGHYSLVYDEQVETRDDGYSRVIPPRTMLTFIKRGGADVPQVFNMFDLMSQCGVIKREVKSEDENAGRDQQSQK